MSRQTKIIVHPYNRKNYSAIKRNKQLILCNLSESQNMLGVEDVLHKSTYYVKSFISSSRTGKAGKNHQESACLGGRQGRGYWKGQEGICWVMTTCYMMRGWIAQWYACVQPATVHLRFVCFIAYKFHIKAGKNCTKQLNSDQWYTSRSI